MLGSHQRQFVNRDQVRDIPPPDVQSSGLIGVAIIHFVSKIDLESIVVLCLSLFLDMLEGLRKRYRSTSHERAGTQEGGDEGRERRHRDKVKKKPPTWFQLLFTRNMGSSYTARQMAGYLPNSHVYPAMSRCHPG